LLYKNFDQNAEKTTIEFALPIELEFQNKLDTIFDNFEQAFDAHR
jgi:hypothetical protein